MKVIFANKNVIFGQVDIAMAPPEIFNALLY
jgi:hypothetical protein